MPIEHGPLLAYIKLHSAELEEDPLGMAVDLILRHIAMIEETIQALIVVVQEPKSGDALSKYTRDTVHLMQLRKKLILFIQGVYAPPGGP